MTNLTAITFAIFAIQLSVRPSDALAFTSHASTLRQSFLAEHSSTGTALGRLPVLFSYGNDETADIVQGDNNASNDSQGEVQNMECSEEEVKVSVQQSSFRDRLEALGIKPVTVSSLRRKAVAPLSLPELEWVSDATGRNITISFEWC
jgi:hypothetical protein